MSPIEGESSSPESEPRDIEALRLKRGHVLAELVETERIYVTELGSIVKGYKMEMTNEAMVHLIPTALVGKADVLFGNLEDIYIFHGETFLRDLENCISNTELVALCFVQRVSVYIIIIHYFQIHITYLFENANLMYLFSARYSLDCIVIIVKIFRDPRNCVNRYRPNRNFSQPVSKNLVTSCRSLPTFLNPFSGLPNISCY